MSTHLKLPYKARAAFKPYHDRKQRFAGMVCHRRAGKTVATVADLVYKAVHFKPKPGWGPGRYAYVAPLYSQAKEIAWDYLQLCRACDGREERLRVVGQADQRVEGPPP